MIFIFGYVVTILMVFYLTFRELTQLYTLDNGIDYIQLENIFDWAVIITTLIYLITIWVDPNLALNFGVWAMLLGWVNLTFYISEFPFIGTIVHAILNVTLSLLPVFVIVLPILCGFMFFFNFTLASDHGAVSDIGKTFLKTIAMMLGNIEIKEFNGPEFNTTTNASSDFKLAMGSNEIGIFGFMMLISVIVMNVMIGLTVNRIDEFLKQAHLIFQEKTLNAIYRFEKINRLNKTSLWNKVEVSLQPKKSNFNIIFSIILRVGRFLKNDVDYLEHKATITSSNNSKQSISISSLVLEEAIKICKKREELVNQALTDTKIFQLTEQQLETLVKLVEQK